MTLLKPTAIVTFSAAAAKSKPSLEYLMKMLLP
jgi:hypothetical protein